MARLTKTRPMLRPCLARAFFVAALLPSLLLGPAIGGQALWFHAHGEGGGHLHLFPVPRALAPTETLGAEHAAAHATAHRHGSDGAHGGLAGDDEAHHHDGEEAPAGFVLKVPVFRAVSASSSRDLARVASPVLSGARGDLGLLAATGSMARPDRSGRERPMCCGRRSGVAALLRSSHAVLI